MSEQTATYTVTPQEIKDAVAMLGKGYKSEAANVAVLLVDLKEIYERIGEILRKFGEIQ